MEEYGFCLDKLNVLARFRDGGALVTQLQDWSAGKPAGAGRGEASEQAPDGPATVRTQAGEDGHREPPT
jgi:hypothetical protein